MMVDAKVFFMPTNLQSSYVESISPAAVVCRKVWPRRRND